MTAPGDLVGSHDGSFFVYDEIHLREPSQYSTQDCRYQIVNEPSPYEDEFAAKGWNMMIGIVISRPMLEEAEYRTGDISYVLFPNVIGWTRTVNIDEVLT